jgi:hypothetical protein
MRTHFFLGCAAAALIACGGRTDEKHGLEGPTVGGETVDYPKGDQGYGVGSVIPNTAILGYEHLDTTTEIDTTTTDVATMHFADFYDPTGERGLTYLYVSIQYVWCGVSNQQEDFTNGGNWTGANTGGENFANEYASSGVRFMTLLAAGPTPGTDATVLDLTNWVTHHKSRISEGLLPQSELTIDVLGAAAPYNMIIDARTMRIVDIEIGFDTRFTKLASLVASLRTFRGH